MLVQRRAGLAQRIGALKGGAGAYRPEREAAILRHVAKTNSGPLGAEPMLAVFREIISACRALEEPMRVAYLGPAGTCSEMKVLEQFGHSVEALACASIDEAFRRGGFRASSHRPPVALPGPPPRATLRPPH